MWKAAKVTFYLHQKLRLLYARVDGASKGLNNPDWSLSWSLPLAASHSWHTMETHSSTIKRGKSQAESHFGCHPTMLDLLEHCTIPRPRLRTTQMDCAAMCILQLWSIICLCCCKKKNIYRFVHLQKSSASFTREAPLTEDLNLFLARRYNSVHTAFI